MPEIESTGAMTRAMRAVPRNHGPLYLRWALVRDGKIVREAVFAPDQMLTIGGDVPCAGVGKPTPLAYFEDGEWRLSVRAGWTGRMGDRELGSGELTLEANTRVVIGGVSVLLQLVERPPQRMRPGLAPSIRGGLFERADYRFTAFVSASLMLHFGLIVFVLESDVAFVSTYEEMQQRRAEWISPEPEEPPDPPVMSDDAEREEMTDRTVTNEPSRHNGDDRPRVRTNDDVQPTLSDDEIASLVNDRIQEVLGGINGQSTGIAALLDDALPSTSEGDLLAMSTDGQVASNDPNTLAERHGNCPSCDVDITELAPGRGPREVAEGPPVQEIVVVAPPPSIFDPEDPPPQGCDAGVMSRAVRVRMTAVQHCYERALTTDGPQVEGRIEIEMQVMPVGSVANVRAVENTTGSEALAACTVRSLETIRLFGCTPEEPFHVRYPLVFHRPD